MPSLKELANAENALVSSIRTAVAAVNRIGTGSVDQALEELSAAVCGAQHRLAIALDRLGALVHGATYDYARASAALDADVAAMTTVPPATEPDGWSPTAPDAAEKLRAMTDQEFASACDQIADTLGAPTPNQPDDAAWDNHLHNGAKDGEADYRKQEKELVEEMRQEDAAMPLPERLVNAMLEGALGCIEPANRVAELVNAEPSANGKKPAKKTRKKK